jgi:2-methylcitrate dehydratase PrpD
MMPLELDRRAVFLSAAASAGAARPAMAQPASIPPPVTQTLARYIVGARFDDLPANVRNQAMRSLLNYVGVAVGGSRHETVDHALAALSVFAGKPEANILGRGERLDVLNAALINGISSHIFDYDDTHLKTIIHPAGPVASAILAFAQHQPVSGRDFLNALVLGIEAECRIGNAVYPSHYEMGWHITGSCGVFGSAAACGKLMGLSEQQMTWALGIAASQPVGLKVQFGSMTKSFHAGRAAQNGLTAALLAAKDFSASEVALEGKDGFGQTLARTVDWREVTQGLGVRYEASLNTYKPFACGIVAHPGIDAAIQLRNQYQIDPLSIASIRLIANPLVLSLTGKTDPQTGLEGKFSIYHCIAVALTVGAAGERQFQDDVVRDPQIVSLRRKVTVQTDPAVKTAQSTLTLQLADGRSLSRHIDHAIGSLENPMSDAALDKKFLDLVTDILPSGRGQDLIALCRGIDRQDDAAVVARAAVP